jgi:hypothetical protein
VITLLLLLMPDKLLLKEAYSSKILYIPGL